jgi:hypothetical protein
MFSGRQGVTASAVALPAQPCNQVTLKALAGNTAPAMIGPAGVTAGNGFELSPGQSVTVSLSNLNQLYIIGTAGDKVSWLGS